MTDKPYELTAHQHAPLRLPPAVANAAASGTVTNVQFLRATFGDPDGARVLVVFDRLAPEAKRSGDLLTPEQEQVLTNCLDHVLTHEADRPVGTIDFDFYRAIEHANNPFASLCNRRVFRLAARNDAVILISGLCAFQSLMEEAHSRGPDFDYAYLMGRVVQVEYEGRTHSVVGTIDFLDLSLQGATDKEREKLASTVWLLGIFCRALATAINGRNRYEVDLTDHRIEYVDTIPKFDAFFEKLRRAKVVCLDTETRGLERKTNVLYSIQFCMDGKTAYFVPLFHPETPFDAASLLHITTKLRHYFERGRSKFHVWHNAQFDLTVLRIEDKSLGVRFYNHRVYDTMAGEFLLDENRKFLKNYKTPKMRHGITPYALGFLAPQYGAMTYFDIPFSKADRSNMAVARLDNAMVEYSCYDVLIPFQIMRFQLAEARRVAYDGFLRLILFQMDAIIKALSMVEFNGMPVDRRYVYELVSVESPYRQKLKQAVESFYKMPAVRRCNTYLIRKSGMPTHGGLFGRDTQLFSYRKNPHKQLLFFRTLKLKPLRLTKNGEGSTDKKFIEANREVPEVAGFAEIGEMEKFYSTFILGVYLKMRDDPDCRFDDRLRPHFGWRDVVTGRTASFAPNLQNMPQRSDLSRVTKRMFRARKGRVYVKVDYGAHEVRGWANVSGDKKLSASLRLGMKYKNQYRLAPSTKLKEDIETKGDIHKQNYKFFFGRFPNDDNERYSVKALIFGVIYGKGSYGLSQDKKLNVDEEGAQNLIDTLFLTFKEGGEWIRKTHDISRTSFKAISPIKRVRHMWGYLHNKPMIHRRMDRRGPNCVDSQTRCLTEDGWKSFREVKVGDLIYTKNVRTGQLELQSIEALTVSKYKGTMLRFAGGIDALTTPNHRWLVDYGKGKNQRPEIVSSLYIGCSKNNNPIHLVADYPVYQEGDGTWTNDEVALLGWILTDAHYNKDRPNSVAICQSIRGNPHKVRMIDGILRRLRVKHSRHGPNSTYKIVWKVAGQFGRKIRDALPDRVMTSDFLKSLSTKQLHILFNSMMLGNGSFLKKYNRYSHFCAGRKDKAEAFSMLCVLLGKSHKILSVEPREPEFYKKYASMPCIAIQRQTMWLVELKQRNRAQGMFGQSWEKFNGIVWCPTVANGTFIANRNGSVYVTGNSNIQGFASDMMTYAARILEEVMWRAFGSKNDFFDWQVTNYIHDSIESEVAIHLVPIYWYLIEHCCTTLLHRRLREIYGIEFGVGLEIDFAFGITQDRMEKWDYNVDGQGVKEYNKKKDVWKDVPNLSQIFDGLIEQGTKLDPDYWTQEVISKTKRAFAHNLSIIHDLRTSELREVEAKGLNPCYDMLLDIDRIDQYGFVLTIEGNLPS